MSEVYRNASIVPEYIETREDAVRNYYADNYLRTHEMLDFLVDVRFECSRLTESI